MTPDLREELENALRGNDGLLGKVFALLEPDKATNLVFDETSWLDDRPANVNADGEFLYGVSGYEGFPALYARRVSSRSAKVSR